MEMGHRVPPPPGPTRAQGLLEVPVMRCHAPQNVLPPPLHLSRHLFAIANVAYSKVLDAKHNQCIVIR